MFGDSPSELQEDILAVARRNPDMSTKHIADRCDCSTSYVRETLNKYGGPGVGSGGGLL